MTTHDRARAVGSLAGLGVEAALAVQLGNTRANWCKCWAAVNSALPDMQPWEVTRFLHAHGYHPLPHC